MLHRRARAAFTLIELMIVISLIVVLAALGVGALTELIPRYKARDAAEQFAADVEELRMMAIMNDKETRLVVTDYDTDPYNPGAGAGAWSLYVGNKNLNSTFWDQLPYEASKSTDAYSGEGVRDLSTGTYKVKNVGLVEPDVTAIVFNPRGWVTNDASDFGYSSNASSIDYVFANKAQKGTDHDIYTVKVFRGGMVRIEAGFGDQYEAHEGGTASTSSRP
ncbi:MAG: GspH/FimT family pseudopilin [Myxococcota bacterium]|nr:GspH/FimT family pseudopilin [Myxococcota bacterium]